MRTRGGAVEAGIRSFASAPPPLAALTCLLENAITSFSFSPLFEQGEGGTEEEKQPFLLIERSWLGEGENQDVIY